MLAWLEMGVGERWKKKMDRVLNNRAIRSTVKFTPITKTIGAHGGYEPPIETIGAKVTVNCIPSDYFGTRMLEMGAGNFDSGDMKIIIKAEETITKDYTVEWQSETYEVEEIRPFILNNIKCAQIVNLSKQTS